MEKEKLFSTYFLFFGLIGFMTNLSITDSSTPVSEPRIVIFMALLASAVVSGLVAWITKRYSSSWRFGILLFGLCIGGMPLIFYSLTHYRMNVPISITEFANVIGTVCTIMGGLWYLLSVSDKLKVVIRKYT